MFGLQKLHYLLAGCFCALALLASPIRAQSDGDPPPSAGQPSGSTGPAAGATSSPSPETTPAAPDPTTAVPPVGDGSDLNTYYLRDAKGNLVPVLGMSFEEFERLMKIKKGLAPADPPPYTLDTLSVTGSADAKLATFQVEVTLRTRKPGWVRVPLRLNKAVLKKPPEHTGDGQFFVVCDAAGDGYVAWLEAEPTTAEAPMSSHKVVLQFEAPLQQLGDERRLSLALPQATESSVTLKVNVPQARAALRGGPEGLVSTKPAGEDHSEINVLGAAGDIQLAWQPGRVGQASDANNLEATGEVLLKVEGRTKVASDIRLRVRNQATTIESFRVRLPLGMELTPASPAGYSVSTISAAQAPTEGSDGRQVVEIKPDRPSSGPIDIRLAATLASQQAIAGPLQPAGWEVIGAGRHRGTIEAIVDGDWQLQWTEDAGVRRTDPLLDSTNMTKVAARFEYFRQPCGLKLQVAQRPTRISVEPTYVVFVDGQQTRLEATLRYRVRGLRAEALTINAGDWKLDRVSPDAFVTPDSLAAEPGKPWRLTLTEAAATEMEIKIEAHQPTPAPGSSLTFTLPQPQADVAAPATVVVLAADNVELIPSNANRSLSPDAAPATLKLPARQQPPLVYRDLGGSEPAQFTAQFQLRDRQTDVSTETLVQLDRQRIRVEQRLSYRIAYEPQRVFELAVPTEVQRASGLHVVFGAEVLPLEPTTKVVIGDAPTIFRFVAPRDVIGPCDFQVVYSLALPPLSREKEASISVPLTAPAEHAASDFSNHSLTVTAADDLRLEGVEAPSDATVQVVSPRQIQVALTKPLAEIDCRVLLNDEPLAATTEVQRLWLQTWLTSSFRQDRAAWRLATDQKFIRIHLPTGASLADVQGAINGVRVDRITRDRGTLRIEVPPDSEGKPLTVELWYRLARSTPKWGISAETLQPPVLDGGAPARRCYWQVCLPRREHLIADPNDYSAELAWTWDRFFWKRRGTLTQPELERWVSASTQTPLPDDGNNYVFSGFGRATPLRLVSASQRAVLLAGAFFALALGLTLIHFRWARTPALLFVAAVALGAAALSMPETALMIGQAAVLGLGATMVSVVAHWLTSGRTVGRQFAEAPEPAAEPKSQPPGPMRVERVQSATTATAPLAVDAAEQRP